jgi:hypothetical protein
VGNYTDATNTINSSSSGAHDAPNTKNDKPELSAPGTSINAGGFTMTGTSQATPHVAGLLADETEKSPYLWRNPYVSKAHMMAAATDAIVGGFDVVGLGGSDYLSGYWSSDDHWWSGSNSDFSSWATNDGGNDSYAIEVSFNAFAGERVRVVLAWLTRGVDTYFHRNSANPIGLDFDLTVLGPGVNCNSWSLHNPFERCNFTAQSGTYKAYISFPKNRDTSAVLKVGLAINYY